MSRASAAAAYALTGRGLVVVLALVAAAGWTYLARTGDGAGVVAGVPATLAALGVLALRRVLRRP